MSAHGLVQAFDVALVQGQVFLVRVVPDVNRVGSDVAVGLERMDRVRVVAHAEQLHDEGLVGGPVQFTDAGTVVDAGIEQSEVASLERLGRLAAGLGLDEGDQEAHAADIHCELAGF